MPPTGSLPTHRSWAAALAVFGGVYLLLYVVYMHVPDPVLMHGVYHHGIVAPGAMLIHVLAPADPVQAVGNRLVSGTTVLEVVRGCDGAGVLFLLIAAILSVRAPLARTSAGLAGAFAFVYALNQVRIVVLFFVVDGGGSFFAPLHAFVFPTAFVLLGLVYFALWTSVSGATRHGPAQPS
jgi:exosortase family protein XrtM